MRNANCKDLFFNKIYFEKFYSTKFWFKKVLVFVVIWSDCSKSMIHHNIYDGSTMKVQPGESIFSTPLIYCLSPHPMGWNSFWRGLMSPLSPAFSQVFINLKLSGAHLVLPIWCCKIVLGDKLRRMLPQKSFHPIVVPFLCPIQILH